MNKVIVITGTSQGIGRACAQRYIDKAYTVFGIDKKTSNLEGLNEFIADLKNHEERQYFVDYILSKVKHVDIFVHNAMEYHSGILDDCDLDGFRDALEVGVVAPYHFISLLKDHMADHASMINIVSTRAFQTQKNNEAYASAKGALNSLTIALANSLGPKIRVNGIAPGWINTQGSELSSQDINQHPTSSVGLADDIVDAIEYLSSDKAKFITGQTLVVDGGMSKQMIYHNDEGWIFKG